MLPRYTASDSSSLPGWNELGESVPLVAALANLSAKAWANSGAPESEPARPDSERPDAKQVALTSTMQLLDREALALLAAAAPQGFFELRTAPSEFDSSDRMLAVSVELPHQRRLVFKQAAKPRKTIRFLEAFRQLCQYGLVIHQLQKEFSLSSLGFEMATQLDPREFEEELKFAKELDA